MLRRGRRTDGRDHHGDVAELNLRLHRIDPFIVRVENLAMTLKKSHTTEEFEELCRSVGKAHEVISDTWRLSLPVLPVQSPQYRSLCTAGKKVQTLLDQLIDEACQRGYSEKDRDQLFGEKALHHISYG